MLSGEFLKFIHDAETGVKQRGLFEGHGPLAILLIVFLGGLALNLTPCVLPMIPINLAIIGAGAQAGSRGRGFLLGADVRRGDGARLRRPRPRRHPDGRHVRHDQRVAVVQRRASPCCSSSSRWRCSTSSRSTSRGFSSGFRARRIVARHVPARVRHGRRRGAARRRVRRAGRHPGRAVLEQPVREGHDDRARAAVLPRRRHGGAVADRRRGHRVAAEARRVDGARQAGLRRPHPRDGAVLRLRGVRASSPTAGSIRPSVASSVRGAAQGRLARRRSPKASTTARREHKPVLIDMWATWCKNCLTMDKTTLEDPAVTAALAGYVKIKFQAEDPDDPRRKARDAALRRRRPADLRHPAPGESLTTAQNSQRIVLWETTSAVGTPPQAWCRLPADV